MTAPRTAHLTPATMSRSRCASFVACLLLLPASVHQVTADGQTAAVPTFSRDVLPILSDRCFHCHGPDESHREAGLRLDVYDDAIADRGGNAAIVPGDADASEVMVRILTQDVDARMPPPAAHRKPLSPAEIATLRSWIESGAAWGRHWAFEKPVRPPVDSDLPPEHTEIASAAVAPHPIDALVKRRLATLNKDLSPPAGKETLIRRLSFDLIGLPPTIEEVDRFRDDTSPSAYTDLVDRLLSSPHHGERMAMWWLDAARYADTDGFQGDATRTNWPYRDWVIEAFNRNMPFDQFTIEQFAGDLLPDATPEQILATCFHRNHMTNGEGGRDPEESRIDYVIDRVNTTGTLWLGLTLGCTQCHSHKFDPISHQDYYSLFAYFNSIDEDGKAGPAAKPYLKYKSSTTDASIAEAQQWADRCIAAESAAKAAAQQEFPRWLNDKSLQILSRHAVAPLSADSSVASGSPYTPWISPQIQSLLSIEGTVLSQATDGDIVASGPTPRQDDYRITANSELRAITGFRLEVLPHETHTHGKWTRGKDGVFILTNVKLQVRKTGESQVREIAIDSAVANVEAKVKGRNYGLVNDTLNDDPRNGWTLTDESEPPLIATAIFALERPLTLADDEELVLWLMHRSTDGDANIGRFRLALTDQPGRAVRSVEPMPIEELATWLTTTQPPTPQLSTHPPDFDSKVVGKLRDQLMEQFLFDHPALQTAKQIADSARRHLAATKKAAGELSVMVLAERDDARPTHVLQRGVWDQKGETVMRAFPHAILPLPANESETRLDLARWLVHRDNPLTSRVMANHLWQIAFGDALVRTPEDFGLQGERPFHPDVLDWLAVELVESGWDLRHLLRLIVTSDTYRQSSAASPEAIEADPANRQLARGARYRLPSWMLRDAALRTSGLLNPSTGGPPVMPYQPPGVWEEIFMGRYSYDPSPGPAQYRRTVYAFWRRSSAPTFLFDSAQRRVCEVKTMRTNTPLHALTLLNDITMLESASNIARLSLESTLPSDERLTHLFRRIVSRHPEKVELDVMRETLIKAIDTYAKSPDQASALIAIGQPQPSESANANANADTAQGEIENNVQVAAYMIVASLVMNLDEAITHE